MVASPGQVSANHSFSPTVKVQIKAKAGFNEPIFVELGSLERLAFGAKSTNQYLRLKPTFSVWLEAGFKQFQFAIVVNIPNRRWLVIVKASVLHNELATFGIAPEFGWRDYLCFGIRLSKFNQHQAIAPRMRTSQTIKTLIAIAELYRIICSMYVGESDIAG